jgi:hypothetical protein
MRLSKQELSERKQFTLSTRELEQMNDQGTSGESRRFGRGHRGVRALKCPSCDQIAACLSYECPKDGEIFAVRARDGSEARCPKCGGPPQTAP